MTHFNNTIFDILYNVSTVTSCVIQITNYLVYMEHYIYIVQRIMPRTFQTLNTTKNCRNVFYMFSIHVSRNILYVSKIWMKNSETNTNS